MLKVKAKLIAFDKPDLNGHIFPKDCKITLPDNAPILTPDSDSIMNKKQAGIAANFVRNDDYVVFDGYIHSKDEDVYKQVIKDPGLYCGGFYNGVKRHKENGLEVIDSMNLRSIGLYYSDIFGDESLRLEIVEDKENERKTES